MIEILQLIWKHGVPCLFQMATGLYCPGCGGTRAVKYLLKGEIWNSFCYHPLILYIIAITAVEFLSWMLSKFLKKPRLYIGRHNFFIGIGIALIGVNWIFKNFMLIVMGIDLLP